MEISKQSVKRADLKANILAKVTLRIDFTRVLDVTNFINDVQQNLGKEFEYREGLLNEVELTINDPDPVSNEIILKKSINKEIVYRFLDERKKVEISISRFFISFDIRCNSTYCFGNYIDKFSEIIAMLEARYELINIVRLGLRKVNIVICPDIEAVYACFNRNLYLNYSPHSGESRLSLLKSQWADYFTLDGYGFNLIKQITPGIMKDYSDEKEVLQVVLDIDGYLKDELLLEKPVSAKNVKEIIIDINNNIFNVFKDHITEAFIVELINGGSSKILEGVNVNAVC